MDHLPPVLSCVVAEYAKPPHPCSEGIIGYVREWSWGIDSAHSRHKYMTAMLARHHMMISARVYDHVDLLDDDVYDYYANELRATGYRPPLGRGNRLHLWRESDILLITDARTARRHVEAEVVEVADGQ